ncbi:MAG: short-chain dehydrogenase [Alphaproteobacteria bacterium HGW-Alphaproteobacteria-2]|nr:MAG: short-chain dehydrogenase [Alphaproteobacteria bacterium HGW-Alphaproteobacteria-2]
MNDDKGYRSALVTGASRGIGAAVARRLLAGGLTVYGVARSAEALAGVAAELGERFIPCPADVRDTDAILAGLGGAEIDVLVNNAGGLASVRPLVEQTAEETAETIALNLTAPLQLMRRLLPGMVARRRGHVFNLTSTAGRSVLPGTTAYAAAKAGLSQACHVLRYDLAGAGVRITELAPARVETDFYLSAFAGDREALRQKLYTTQRALSPEDIAQTIWAALSLPPHADLSEIVITSTDQAAGGQMFAARDGS